MFSLHIAEAQPWWTRFQPTVHYLMETEAHVYALAIAASTLLAFYPFMMVMLSFCRDVLHWPAAMQAIYIALGDFFAGEPGRFFVYNMRPSLVPKLHIASMILLLFTANGIFEPLEVALNRAWGVEKNRTYLKNQLISLGLIFVCGGLAMLSLMLTAANSQWIAQFTASNSWVETGLKVAVFKVAALAASMLALFVIYWLLPNRKVEPRRVVPVAIVVGIIMELLKYVNLLVWQRLQVKLNHEYAIFQHSVTILVWSFAVAMVVLAGAHWTARQEKPDPLA